MSEYERARREIVLSFAASAERTLAERDPSETLDATRTAVEGIVGEPCLARWEGTKIVVSYPVIRRGATSYAPS